jgi:Leucine-rich repeat (LRR) protein
MKKRGFFASSYVELEEAPSVLTPLQPTSVLSPEHFSAPLQELRYPAKLDFSHERFRLRSLSLLSMMKESALQEIDLSDNELQSLHELQRFSALKTLSARRNSLISGPGMQFTMHRLSRLDVSDNRLTEVPPLKELPLLQVSSAIDRPANPMESVLSSHFCAPVPPGAQHWTQQHQQRME